MCYSNPFLTCYLEFVIFVTNRSEESRYVVPWVLLFGWHLVKVSAGSVDVDYTICGERGSAHLGLLFLPLTTGYDLASCFPFLVSLWGCTVWFLRVLWF